MGRDKILERGGFIKILAGGGIPTGGIPAVSLLSVVSKVFEKLVNNRIVDHLEKCGLFSDFQYGFRSSLSTADLLTVVSEVVIELLGLLTGLGLLEL